MIDQEDFAMLATAEGDLGLVRWGACRARAAEEAARLGVAVTIRDAVHDDVLLTVLPARKVRS